MVKRIGLDEHQYQFEWDEAKAAANLRKHGVSFELASSILVILEFSLSPTRRTASNGVGSPRQAKLTGRT